MSRRFVWFLVFVATMSTAHANGIVLESYTGERPADAARLIAPVLEELSRKKFAAGDTIARTYETQVSRSAQRSAGVPADFSEQVDAGFKAWVAGKFDLAIKQLGPLVELAHANTGEIAKTPALREPLLKALIALAIAYQRIGDPSAMRATFGEIVRSYPDVQISRGTYGPDAAQAFEQVKREVQATGRGKLTVKLADDSAVVFVNELYRAAGSTTLELAPGEYRVVAMLNKQPSRNHRVTVRAGGEVTVAIDAKLDQAMRTQGYTGLAFTNQAERDSNEAAYAARIARDIGASAVAVVGIDQVRGKSAVVGSLVSLETGREIRRASIPVEPDPSTDKLRALARFLGGEEPEPGLDVQFATAAAEAKRDTGSDEETPRSGRWGGWRWLTAGVAVGALATGGVLLGLDGRCTEEPPAGQQCLNFYEFSVAGFATLGGGAVVAGISVYLFATQDSAQSAAKTAYIAPAEGGAIAGIAGRW